MIMLSYILRERFAFFLFTAIAIFWDGVLNLAHVVLLCFFLSLLNFSIGKQKKEKPPKCINFKASQHLSWHCPLKAAVYVPCCVYNGRQWGRHCFGWASRRRGSEAAQQLLIPRWPPSTETPRNQPDTQAKALA